VIAAAAYVTDNKLILIFSVNITATADGGGLDIFIHHKMIVAKKMQSKKKSNDNTVKYD